MLSIKKLTKRSLASEMERNVKQMLNLIEEDGDSFAQKAEMYYQKRPELISLVEELYRGCKTLAERYDDLQSCYSDNGSEPNSNWPSPSPRKMGRRISSSRAAGFDFFLGSSLGGNVNNNNNGDYEASHKDGDGSSTLTDSDDESDASSINSFNSGFFGRSGGSNGNGGDHGMNRRVVELEMELREVKEKLCMYEDHHGGLSKNKETRMDENGNGEDLRAKVNAYEQELRNVNEKLRLSEEEITKLKVEIVKCRSLESGNLHDGVEYLSCDEHKDNEHNDNESIEEELRITKLKLKSSEMQIASLRFEASKSSESIQHLQDQLNLSMKEIASWKTKFNNLKRSETTKPQEKTLRTNLADKENEIRDLKTALSNAEQSIFSEKAQLKSEISRLLGSQTRLEEEIRKVQSEKVKMEEALKGEIEVKKSNIIGLNATLYTVNLQVEELKSRAKELEEENERQRCEILEGAEEKREAIRQLCFSLEHYRNGYNKLRKAFIDHKRFPVLAAYKVNDSMHA